MDTKRIPPRAWPIAVTVLWVCAAALRWWQLRSAFEADTGLARPLAVSSLAFAAVLLLSGAVLALLARRQSADPALKDSWERALYAPGDRLALAGLVLAAFLALAAGGVLLRQGLSLFSAWRRARASLGNTAVKANSGLLCLACSLCAVGTFAALLTAGRRSLRSQRCGGAPLMAAVCGCVWMMDTYRSHAADPVRWDYVPLLLAALAGLLFFLDWGGMTCGAPRPYRLLWLAGMTVVLSAAALVGCDEAGSLLLLACQAIAALTVLYRLPRNLNHPPEAPAQPPREEEVEEEPHV